MILIWNQLSFETETSLRFGLSPTHCHPPISSPWPTSCPRNHSSEFRPLGFKLSKPALDLVLLSVSLTLIFHTNLVISLSPRVFFVPSDLHLSMFFFFIKDRNVDAGEPLHADLRSQELDRRPAQIPDRFLRSIPSF